MFSETTVSSSKEIDFRDFSNIYRYISSFIVFESSNVKANRYFGETQLLILFIYILSKNEVYDNVNF